MAEGRRRAVRQPVRPRVQEQHAAILPSRGGRGRDPAAGGDERARDGRDAQGEGGQRGVAASDDGSYFGDDINHIN